MRVAVVHDFLCQRGGAERVVLHLCRLLADPVVVTSLYVPEATYPEFSRYEVRAARTAGVDEAATFRRRALSYPSDFRRADVSDAEVVIVSSSAFAHHVRHPRSAVYWHTPPRFLYDASAYVRSRPGSFALEAATRPFRRVDAAAARAHLLHAANSRRTADRLARCYGIETSVIHPPLALGAFPPAPPEPPRRRAALVVSRLLPYKRVDLAVAACARAGIPLTVVGEGPDEGRIRRLAAGADVSFLGSLGDEELRVAYLEHAVVVAPAVEDFGFVPLEAALCGRPSVAPLADGLTATVRDGLTGRLVRGWSVAEWSEAILATMSARFSGEALRLHAAAFGPDVFDAAFARFIGKVADPSGLFAAGASSGRALAEAAL